MTGRRAVLTGMLLLPLALAACAGEDVAPIAYAPLRYDYLRKLRLNVARLDIDQRWVPLAGGNDVAALSPVPPVEALRQLATDRLVAIGSSGRAVFVIEDAAILQAADRYAGHLQVRLDIYTDAPTPIAYAEASVGRTRDAPAGDAAARQVLYQLTRQMMDDLNVEFEFQVRRALGSWLQPGTSAAPAPAPVEEQNLAPPPRS